MKKTKILPYFCLISLLIHIFVFSATPEAFALEGPATVSDRIILLDASTGNTLYSKNAEEKAYPASLTKVMTALLAVEAMERGEIALSDKITCSEKMTYDLIEDGSSAGIKPGEVMTVEELLYCSLVASANEACNVLAEYVSGSVVGFIELMNKRAAELGCTSTHFDNTHGLPNTEHYTSAADMARISYEASKHEIFMQFCNTSSITIPATNMSGERHLSNTNGLINPNSQFYPHYAYDYASGIKTGHTDAAGYCLSSTAAMGDVKLLCVVMGGKESVSADSKKYSSFDDSIEVYNWAFANFSYHPVLNMTDLVSEIPISLAKDSLLVLVHPQDTVRVLAANDEELDQYEQRITIYSEESGEELVAPILAGEVLGEIEILHNGASCGSTKLLASSGHELSYSKLISSKVGATLKKPAVIILLIIVLALIGIYIYLRVRYNRTKRQYYKELRRRESDAAKQIPVFKSSGGSYVKKKNPGDKNETAAERDYYKEFFED